MSSNRRQPSLLFVFADQWRGMDLGCAGNPDVLTPNLDRFASEGIRCTSAFANTPVCGPSRASLLTGTSPLVNGVIGNDLALRPGLPTLGTVAKAQGLRTGYIGKWHLDGQPRDKFTPPGARRRGFDYWAVNNCSHDYFNPRYFRDEPAVIAEEGYEPVVQTRLALEHLDSLRPDEAFCLLLSWGPPHDPYLEVPRRYRQLYDPAQLSLRGNAEPEAANPLAAGKNCAETTAAYYAAMTALDEQFGRLLAGLDRLGRREDTLVVFTSDHGDMLWSHGLMKKQLPYEEACSIPLLARWPGHLPAGRTISGLFGVLDFLPTLAGLLGWEVPPALDGINASELWRGRDPIGPISSIYLADYIPGEEAARQSGVPWRAVRTLQYLYAERRAGEGWLLFDQQADPLQQHNLAGKRDFRDIQAALAAQLAAKLAASGDPFGSGPAFLDQLGLADAWADRCRQLAEYWQRIRAS